VISQVGGSIRAALRTEDVAGRLGGDEFAVVLPYTRTNDAAHVVQRLLDAIRGLSGPMPGARGTIDVSASIGFETFDGTDLDSSDTLRVHAEEALRLAKQGGGNRGVYFRATPDEKPTK
jgi:diguanylate cyclase (GGDEF)-like protein